MKDVENPHRKTHIREARLAATCGSKPNALTDSMTFHDMKCRLSDAQLTTLARRASRLDDVQEAEKMTPSMRINGVRTARGDWPQSDKRRKGLVRSSLGSKELEEYQKAHGDKRGKHSRPAGVQRARGVSKGT